MTPKIQVGDRVIVDGHGAEPEIGTVDLLRGPWAIVKVSETANGSQEFVYVHREHVTPIGVIQ
jgi:hypothetical protein